MQRPPGEGPGVCECPSSQGMFSVGVLSAQHRALNFLMSLTSHQNSPEKWGEDAAGNLYFPKAPGDTGQRRQRSPQPPADPGIGPAMGQQPQALAVTLSLLESTVAGTGGPRVLMLQPLT